MLLGSGEHIGWENPREAKLITVLSGDNHPQEFARVQAPGGVYGGSLNVIVRPRHGEAHWHAPAPGEQIEVAAWKLSEGQVLDLNAEAKTGNNLSWAPPKPLPDMWLWVRG